MRKISIFAVFCAFAATAFAQTPPLKQSGGPTSNESRIRIVEPLEGAVLTGNDFKLVVQDQQFPSGTAMSPDAQRDAVRPVYQLFVDGKDLGNVPMDQNVIQVRVDGFGPHKVILLAKNGAGQLIDRKELNVVTREDAVAASTAPVAAQPETARMEPVAPAPVAVTAPTASEPVAPSPMGTERPETATSSTLPATGTAYPAAAAAGVALFAMGAVIRRRRV